MSVSDAEYGSLSAEFYQLTKPIGADYPDINYYLEQLSGISGPVLELGAGTGRLLIPLLANDIAIEALEPSGPMTQWLQKNLKLLKLKCKILKTKMEDLAAKNHYGAIVISFGSFQLLDSQAKALECLRRSYAALKKGGKLYIDLDVIRPELHKAGVKTYGTKIDCPDSSAILLEGARHWDFIQQQEFVHLRYERWKDGEVTQTELQDFSLRWYGRWEFSAMLREVGFTNIEVCADYDIESGEAGLHAENSTLCFSAQKK